MTDSSLTSEVFISSISLPQISSEYAHFKRWETQTESYSKA